MRDCGHRSPRSSPPLRRPGAGSGAGVVSRRLRAARPEFASGTVCHPRCRDRTGSPPPGPCGERMRPAPSTQLATMLRRRLRCNPARARRGPRRGTQPRLQSGATGPAAQWSGQLRQVARACAAQTRISPAPMRNSATSTQLRGINGLPIPRLISVLEAERWTFWSPVLRARARHGALRAPGAELRGTRAP